MANGDDQAQPDSRVVGFLAVEMALPRPPGLAKAPWASAGSCLTG